MLLSNTELQVDRYPYHEEPVNVAVQALQLEIAEKIPILGCSALTSSPVTLIGAVLQTPAW